MIADMAMKEADDGVRPPPAPGRATLFGGLASDVAMEVTHRRLPGGADDARRQDHQIYEGTNQIQRVVMSRALLR